MSAGPDTEMWDANDIPIDYIVQPWETFNRDRTRLGNNLPEVRLWQHNPVRTEISKPEHLDNFYDTFLQRVIEALQDNEEHQMLQDWRSQGLLVGLDYKSTIFAIALILSRRQVQEQTSLNR